MASVAIASCRRPSRERAGSPSVRLPGAGRRRQSQSGRTRTGLLLQRLFFAGGVYNASEIAQGAEPKIRDQERTLAERLISELSETEFQPEKYEDEYRQRLQKAIEHKIAGQEIQRVEVEIRPPTTDLVATLQASLGRKELAKAPPGKSKREPASEKRPVRRKHAS
jgi:DNA end-binding protein Ku